jgi:hypothetical protein
MKHISSDLYAAIEKKYQAIAPHLNEHSRRIWAASEAHALGHGGKKIIHAITHLSYTTIHAGQVELEAIEQSDTAEKRIRKKGGGRKKSIVNDATLKSDVMDIIESATRGDPETPLLWSSKSTRKIAEELNKDKQRASHSLVSRVLDEMDYSLQGNRKVKEGSNHPDRDAQFKFIATKVKDFQGRNQPVISVDTKKKELIGEFKNAGQEYRKKRLR